jgi:hypothetical protein
VAFPPALPTPAAASPRVEPTSEIQPPTSITAVESS